MQKQKTGVHVGESGFPSSAKKLQDNDYYQDFSYVLQTTDSIDVWKQDVLKLLHPAGFKLFGEVAIATLLNSQMFDRGLNNINSLNADGIARYREMGMRFFTVVLDNLFVTAETVLNQEIEFKVSPTRIKAEMGQSNCPSRGYFRRIFVGRRWNTNHIDRSFILRRSFRFWIYAN